MDVTARCNLPRRIQFLPEYKERVRPLIIKWTNERRKIRFFISGEAYIRGTEVGGWIVIDPEPSDIRMEVWYKQGSTTQKNTLRAMEALLYWANFNQYPPKSSLLHDIHEEIIAQTGLYRESPITGKVVRISTSSPMCTTSDMNRFIDTAVKFLLEADIPPHMIEPASQKDFKGLYLAWYQKRSVDEELDGIKTWEDYCKRFPYDEFLCVLVPEKGTGQTQKIHIVSRGASTEAIDEPWNWIRGATSIHTKIHQYGWEPVLQEFPHLVPKVTRARKLAHKKELI